MISRITIEGPPAAVERVVTMLATEEWARDVSMCGAAADDARHYVDVRPGGERLRPRLQAVVLGPRGPSGSRFVELGGARHYVGAVYRVSLAGRVGEALIAATSPLHRAAVAPGDVLHVLGGDADAPLRVVGWEPLAPAGNPGSPAPTVERLAALRAVRVRRLQGWLRKFGQRVRAAAESDEVVAEAAGVLGSLAAIAGGGVAGAKNAAVALARLVLRLAAYGSLGGLWRLAVERAELFDAIAAADGFVALIPEGVRRGDPAGKVLAAYSAAVVERFVFVELGRTLETGGGE